MKSKDIFKRGLIVDAKQAKEGLIAFIKERPQAPQMSEEEFKDIKMRLHDCFKRGTITQEKLNEELETLQEHYNDTDEKEFFAALEANLWALPNNDPHLLKFRDVVNIFNKFIDRFRTGDESVLGQDEFNRADNTLREWLNYWAEMGIEPTADEFLEWVTNHFYISMDCFFEEAEISTDLLVTAQNKRHEARDSEHLAQLTLSYLFVLSKIQTKEKFDV